MKTSEILPPTYMLIAMLVMVALHFILPAAIIPTPWNLLGMIPIGLGAYVAVAAENAFRSADTTVKPFVESTTLVTNGVYRISRNPMYLGFVLVLVGIAILMRSLTPFIVIPLFTALIQLIFIKDEEQMLAAKFGARFEAYTNSVRRWL